ncbi:MAG: Holliday junction resolvase Hjc [Candidatus Pacearchaeota archaeon]
MGNKEKGSNAERELYKIFLDHGFRAVRVAGSGLMKNTACDLIAGNKKGKYAIECKSSKSKYKYITKKQIEEFLIFSEIFGLKPVIAIRFNREGWFFIELEQLEKSKKNFVITLDLVKNKGKRFVQMFC